MESRLDIKVAGVGWDVKSALRVFVRFLCLWVGPNRHYEGTGRGNMEGVSGAHADVFVASCVPSELRRLASPPSSNNGSLGTPWPAAARRALRAVFLFFPGLKAGASTGSCCAGYCQELERASS